MGKPSPPPAPDYTGAAQAQGQANLQAGQQTASLSNPNITNPYGTQSVTYSPTGPNGDMQPNVVQSLNPQSQQTLDAQQRVQTGLANLGEQGLGQAQKILGTPFNTNGVPANPIHPGQTAQDAIMARLQPTMDRNNAQMETQLRNQGISSGTEAWDNAKRDQSQSNNDLLSQASLYGIGLDTNAHQQGLQEAYSLYNQPLNQITALMSGSQIQTPQFQQYQGANVGAAPLFQATQAKGAYDQNSYAQQMAGYNSLVGGIAGIGAGLGTGGFFGSIK